MKISIIVAASENNVIGNNGKIPWHISEDLKRFKEITTGHHILMGRKTYESIGKPLPNRANLVLTKDEKLKIPGAVIFQDFGEALRFARKRKEEELMIIGGEKIYKFALPLAEKIYLTRVLREYEGDAKLPEIENGKWKLVFNESHLDSNPPFEFRTLERKG